MATENTEIIYPTTTDADGFYYEDEVDEARDIQTKEYENGNLIKKVKLSRGKVAIVRELMSSDVSKAYQLAGAKNKEDRRVVAAMISLAVTIDEKPVMMEDVLDTMKAKDYMRLASANAALNF